MKSENRFDIALNKFVNEHKKNPKVIGIIISGSYIHSKLDKNSDLDVFIVTRDSKFRERGNTWINGIEIEYFTNPLKQVYDYFEKEKQTSPNTAHMFVNSKILYEKGEELRKLIKKAEKILEKPRSKMNKFSIENAKYTIDDIRKDLEDTLIKKDKFSFEQISINLLESCLDIFYKIKREYPEKSKRLFEDLNKKDKHFSRLYKQAILEKSMKNKYPKLVKLVRYTEQLLGGKRSKEWKLKSKCPCLEK